MHFSPFTTISSDFFSPFYKTILWCQAAENKSYLGQIYQRFFFHVVSGSEIKQQQVAGHGEKKTRGRCGAAAAAAEPAADRPAKRERQGHAAPCWPPCRVCNTISNP